MMTPMTWIGKRILVSSHRPGNSLGRISLLFAALLLAQHVPAGDCYLLRGKTSGLVGRMDATLKGLHSTVCPAWKTLEITGDALADYSRIQQTVRDGDALISIGTDAAKICRGMKNVRSIGLLIPNGPEFACCMQVISLYPDPQQVYPYLKSRTYTSLILLYASESAERAFHLSMAGRQAGVDIKPVPVETPLDIPTKLRKGLEKAQGALIAIDSKFFDEAFLKLIMEEIRRSGKPAFAFMKVFLDYGADVAFIVEEEDMARAALDRIAGAKENGLVQLETAYVKRGKTAKGDWKDEKLTR